MNGIVPQTLNNARLNSDGIDMQQSRRAMFVLSIGAVTGGGSINAYLQESADNSSWTANDTAGALLQLRRQQRQSNRADYRQQGNHL